MGLLGGQQWYQGGVGTAMGLQNNANTWGVNQLANVYAPGIEQTIGPDQYAPSMLLNVLAGSNGNNGLSNTISQYPSNAQNWAGQFMAPSGWNQQAASNFTNLGNNVLQGLAPQLGNQISGQTANEQLLQDYQNYGLGNLGPMMGTANQVFQGGGWTPQYQQGFNSIGSMLGNNGFAPGLSGIDNTANNIIGMSGINPTIAGLASQGSNLFNQQALMNPAQAAGLAGNLASTATQNQAQQAEANALARGGGAGATVANGMTNQGMSDFANQIAQNTANASNTALQNQQQLQLQQQTLGANALNNAALAQTGYLGAGTNIAQLANSGYLGGINAMTPMMSGENQYTLGMGNLINQGALGMLGGSNNAIGNLNSLLGTTGNVGNIAGQLGVGQGQLGQSEYNALTNAYNNSLQTGLSMGNLYNNMTQAYTNPMTALGQDWINYANTGLGSMGSMLAPGMSVGAGANPTLSSLGSIIGSVGGLIP